MKIGFVVVLIFVALIAGMLLCLYLFVVVAVVVVNLYTYKQMSVKTSTLQPTVRITLTTIHSTTNNPTGTCYSQTDPTKGDTFDYFLFVQFWQPSTNDSVFTIRMFPLVH